MNNVIITSKNILINAINNISYLKEKNIKLFNSIPLNKKLPYLKINSINSILSDNIFEIFLQYSILIIDENRNNDNIIEIIEKIKQGLKNFTNEIIIIQNLQYEISEDILNDTWQGNLIIKIKILHYN